MPRRSPGNAAGSAASHPPVPASDDGVRHELDPVFLHSRREAIVIFAVWLIALLWSVPFCYATGYPAQVDPASFETVWGIPKWLFWGIFVPWIVADVFTIWFCFWYMEDDDLSGGRPMDELTSGPERTASDVEAEGKDLVEGHDKEVAS